MRIRTKFVAGVACAAATLAFTAGPAAAANNSKQAGLVNLSVGDVDVLNNVNIGVAAGVAATICEVDVPVAVLAAQIIADGSSTVCDSLAGPVMVEQSQTGGSGGGGGGNNAQQAGLVNVALGDIAILNNVNLGVAAAVAATVCDVAVPAAVLAAQAFGDASHTVCTSTAGTPLTIDQATGGGGSGGGNGGGNNAQQAGLVNVALGDVAILNDVNAAVAAAVAATVCDVNVPVAVLARQLIADGSSTVCETAAGPLTVTQAL